MQVQFKTSSHYPDVPPFEMSCVDALAIAHADAKTAYEDLSRHFVKVFQEIDGWHVEYWFRGEGRFHIGGGPHYIIDAKTGEILSKKYYQ